jgi:hypothetical protein
MNFYLILTDIGYKPNFDEIKASPMADRVHYIDHRSDIPSLMTMANLRL